MSWTRMYAKKWFGPYLPYVEEAKAARYMTFARCTHFVLASGLAYYVFFISYPEYKRQNQEKGMPIIQDKSSALGIMRRKGIAHATILEYTKEKGWQWIEYDRQKYLEELERDAFARAQEAQKKAIEEGKSLPKDAIRLVDVHNISSTSLKENEEQQEK